MNLSLKLQKANKTHDRHNFFFSFSLKISNEKLCQCRSCRNFHERYRELKNVIKTCYFMILR